jgi:hypothetical protein
MACPQKAVATNPVPDFFLELARDQSLAELELRSN